MPGWTHSYSGKVRDLYVPDYSPTGRQIARVHGDVVLVVTSDRVSAYDHVLSTPVPGKGLVLTQLSLWWFTQLTGVVADPVVSTIVPDAVAGRAVVCRRLRVVPVTCFVRGYLTGSDLVEYQRTGTVGGTALPDGLVHGSRLPAPVVTLVPTTGRSALGDTAEPTGVATPAALRDLTLEIYHWAAALATERGLALASTTLEFGVDSDGRLTLAGDVIAPGSSRIHPTDGWAGRLQPALDEQCVYDWLASPAAGWSGGAATPPRLPDDVVTQVRRCYLDVHYLMTGRDLDRKKGRHTVGAEPESQEENLPAPTVNDTPDAQAPPAESPPAVTVDVPDVQPQPTKDLSVVTADTAVQPQPTEDLSVVTADTPAVQPRSVRTRPTRKRPTRARADGDVPAQPVDVPAHIVPGTRTRPTRKRPTRARPDSDVPAQQTDDQVLVAPVPTP
jgi:phosphoribosylaminoimidazole-succinocarboxamide synthase